VLTAPVANEGALGSDGALLRVAEAFAVSVGKSAARAWSATARAWRKRASATWIVWLAISTRCIS
jgi:hypothetical protein